MAAFSSPSFSTAQAASPNKPPSPRITIRSLRFRLDFSPRVAQGHGAIEHQLLTRTVGIYREVAQPLELVAVTGRGVPKAWLEFRAGHDFKRIGIQVHRKVLTFGNYVRILAREQGFVQANLRIQDR